MLRPYRDIEEATLARLDLVERVQQIDVQLAERAAEVSVGRVPNEKYKSYLEWKARACRAKAVLVSKLSRTKADIQRMRADQAAQRAIDKPGDQLLKELYRVTKTMVSEGVDVSEDEQRVLDSVQEYLLHM